MKEVRQTKLPEIAPVKPAVVTGRRTGERNSLWLLLGLSLWGSGKR